MDHFGSDLPPIRMQAAVQGRLTPGTGWLVRRGSELSDVDGWLLEWPAAPDFVAAALASALPLVLAIDNGALAPGMNASAPNALVDAAVGYVLPGDDAVVVSAVVKAAVKPAGAMPVADGTAQIISALSVEASRIAEQLAALAEQRSAGIVSERPVDAVLVRRLLRVRRDRARFLPPELFADPAWDMLLDLTAARLEGKLTPVSSLCIAAAVPTTTALRWIRSLSDAGIMERRPDPFDARRSHVQLSAAAAEAMLAWLRLFADQFGER
ncbi:MAG: hypothetical protein ACOYKQ_09300 [Polymorphobacter sp.]